MRRMFPFVLVGLLAAGTLFAGLAELSTRDDQPFSNPFEDNDADPGDADEVGAPSTATPSTATPLTTAPPASVAPASRTTPAPIAAPVSTPAPIAAPVSTPAPSSDQGDTPFTGGSVAFAAGLWISAGLLLRRISR